MNITQLKKKINLLGRAIKGQLIKLGYETNLIKVPQKSFIGIKKTKPIVISVTSYGRRVKNLLPITLCSLLKQTLQPDAIVVYLDKEKWNSTNLPNKLRKLIERGVIVKFVKDIRSYTKLIPELSEPTISSDELIITVDDDLYYHKDLVKNLYEAWEKDPNKIHATIGHQITFSKNNKLNSYNHWNLSIKALEGKDIMATGAGGVLYDKKLLHKDTTREDLFKKLSPQADDVWFYFMEYLQGSKINVIPEEKNFVIPLDAFYQLLHKEASLQASNYKESKNDGQIRAVMDYYEITDNIFFKIIKS